MTARPPLDLLVVDDDAPTRRYFEIAARGLGLSTQVAASVSEALSAMQEHSVKLLVSDLHLGKQYADALFGEVALWPPEHRPECVLMSGGLTTEIEARMRQLGVLRFWPKPVPLDFLRRELSPTPATAGPTQAASSLPDAVAAFFGGNQALYERYRAETWPRLQLDLEKCNLAIANNNIPILADTLHNIKTVLKLVGQKNEGDAAEALEKLVTQDGQAVWNGAHLASWNLLHRKLIELIAAELPHD